MIRRTACLLAATALSGLVASTAVADPGDAAIQRVMDKPLYEGSQWGLLEVNPINGRATRSLQPQKSFVPGSVVKIFTVSAAWDRIGPNHRFVTPLYAQGQRSGST